ncbi:MAG: hypothetical protein N2441_00295 [Rhodocyclaceae bacterium]|nr:hypothetical protein [Rhodocyclaceae bacterium]
MTELATRVDTLEEALVKLAHAQYMTELQLRDLAKEMADFKIEMLEFKNEMAEFKNEMAEFKNEMAEFKNEMAEFKNEVRADRKEMNRRWGELVNKWGSIAEDLVYPNIPRIAKELFGASTFEFLGLRVKRSHHEQRGKMREFDTVAAWPDHFLLVEVKASLRPEYFKDFAAFLLSGEVWDYFPEYRERKLIPIFASFSLSASDLAFLTKQRIYGMALGDETMEILNAQEIAALGG